VRFERRGAVVTLRRSKTDQLGAGREVAIPQLQTEALCPVRALRAWLAAAAIVEGPLFRTFSLRGELQENRIDGRDVARLVQRLTGRARLEGDFAAHSLRAGFVTSGAERGIAEASLQNVTVTGHRSAAILRATCGGQRSSMTRRTAHHGRRIASGTGFRDARTPLPWRSRRVS
jgi:hypothetical protein